MGSGVGEKVGGPRPPSRWEIWFPFNIYSPSIIGLFVVPNKNLVSLLKEVGMVPFSWLEAMFKFVSRDSWPMSSGIVPVIRFS